MGIGKTYKILIIDDSALMRRVISDIIKKDDRFEISDIAMDGVQGLDLLVQKNDSYDIVLLDIMMPRMDGLEVLRNINRYRINCKVIVMSALVKEGEKETILALEMGAVDFVSKPSIRNHAVEKASFEERLIHSLNSAIYSGRMPSGTIASARETATGTSPAARATSTARSSAMRKMPAKGVSGGARSPVSGLTVSGQRTINRTFDKPNKLLAIASSTGGPRTLKEIIPKLPKGLDAPVILVQHMPAGFTRSLAERLNELSEITVKEAANEEPLKKGCVYIAPGGTQLRVSKAQDGSPMFRITDDPPVGGLKPCANLMYESLKETSFQSITCVVLTGMGADGTEGIKSLSKSKKIHVIAQDEPTSVVYGMPRAVAEAGLSDEILPLDDIAGAIIKNVGVLNNGC